MKKIILIRHAKSSWNNPGLKDIERPLNKRGQRDAPFMGNLLKEKNLIPEIIYSSPATRALTTAKIIADKINYPHEGISIKNEIYEASALTLFHLISSFNNKHNTVMLIGHNPGFTSLANYLCNNFNHHIPTCGIVELEFDINDWQEVTANSGTLLAFEYPKKYK